MASFNPSNYIISPLSAISSNINFLIFSKIGSQIIQLPGVIDSIPEENHNISVGTSEYPIETGATLTDHAFIKPAELNIIGYISDILISKITTLITPYRDREGWERILLQINKRSLVTIVTLLATYNDMMITDIRAAKTNEFGGNSLVFNMTLKQVLIAETQTTKLPPNQLTGDASNKSGVNNGGDKQSPDSGRPVSIWKRLLEK